MVMGIHEGGGELSFGGKFCYYLYNHYKGVKLVINLSPGFVRSWKGAKVYMISPI